MDRPKDVSRTCKGRRRARPFGAEKLTGALRLKIADVTPPTVAPVVTGVIVDYDVTAKDALDPKPALACTPASGTRFALGVNTVSCSATDAAGNGSASSFGVVVVRAAAPAPVLAAAPAPAVAPAVAPARTQLNPLLSLRFRVKGRPPSSSG
jgi:hypothetical protein